MAARKKKSDNKSPGSSSIKMPGSLIDQYKKIHASKKYGTSGDRVFRPCLAHISPKWKSALDYGCGRSNTLDLLPSTVTKRNRYDPAIPEYENRPDGESFDFVICTDVLEHIPEEEIPFVLSDIFSLSNNVFFSIALRPAIEQLPNGMNAHVTVKPVEWWKERINEASSNKGAANIRQIAYIPKHSWTGLVSLEK